MATIGYARVSTRDQNPEGQTDVLEAAACDRIFVEHASGTIAKRPALTDALSYLRDGDTLVVTKLDRLGRLVRNLKQVADELQQRGIGLKALSQGIDTTTLGAGCSSICSRRSRSSNTTSSSNAPTTISPPLVPVAGRVGRSSR